MLALRAHVLALGHSGVRRDVVLRFVEMLEMDILPVVPEQGSLGASGDLAPLAHLALPVIGEGEVRLAGAAEGEPLGGGRRGADMGNLAAAIDHLLHSPAPEDIVLDMQQ